MAGYSPQGCKESDMTEAIEHEKEAQTFYQKEQNQENALSFGTGVRTFRQQTTGKNKSK